MRASSNGGTRRQPGLRLAIWAWLLLCALTGSRWLIEAVAPETASTALSQAAGCAMAAGLAVLPMLFRSSRRGQRIVRLHGWSALAGGVALSGAALAAAISDRYVHGDNATLALCLAPVVVAVATSARVVGSSDSLTGRLWPGLAGIAGLLLLLPEPRFSSGRWLAALCCMPVLTGIGAALAASPGEDTTSSGTSTRWSLPWTVFALVSAGALYGVVAAVHKNGAFSVCAAGLDGAAALLSVIALRGLGPTRWSAQFLAVPLVTLVEGAVLLRPVLDVRRSGIGFALLVLGSVYLFAVAKDRDTADSGPGPHVA